MRSLHEIDLGSRGLYSRSEHFRANASFSLMTASFLTSFPKYLTSSSYSVSSPARASVFGFDHWACSDKTNALAFCSKAGLELATAGGIAPLVFDVASEQYTSIVIFLATSAKSARRNS